MNNALQQLIHSSSHSLYYYYYTFPLNEHLLHHLVGSFVFSLHIVWVLQGAATL